MGNKILRTIIMIIILLAVPLGVYAEDDDVIINANSLEGTISIMDDGSPQYGETISVDTSQITNNTGALNYQWLRDGMEISEETNSTYTFKQEDISDNISVTITSSVETGTITSNIISPTKADRQAPIKPILHSMDHNSVELVVVEGCQYKKDNDSFGTSNTFNDLKSNTTYTFYQRYPETDTHNASPVSEGLSVTTDYIQISDTSYDISNLNVGDSIIISGNVTLTGSKNISVQCNTGVQLTLDDVYINAAGMANKCGIKFSGNNNKLIIKGNNRVYSGSDKAGIEVQGSLTISGNGTLYVKGGVNGAGIGGSNMQDAGTINITGGEITVLSGTNAAAIGGGNEGSGGNVTISSGLVFASGSSSDIGGGNLGSDGTLSIFGASAVFLKNNLSTTPSTSSHSLYSSETVSSSKAYGYTLPSIWANGDTAHAYINYYTVTFNTNGGGNINSQTVSAATTVSTPSNPSRQGLIFAGWYSDSGLTNIFDFENDRIYSDVTLYAKWNVKVTVTVNEGGNVAPKGITEIELGKDLIITCEPNEHYYVGEVTSSKNHSIVDNGDNTYTIKNITSVDEIKIFYESEILLGTVMIEHDGVAEYGDTLSVYTEKITNNPEDGKLEYQWKRDGKDISGATKDTYIIQKEDIGSKVSVEVSSTKKEGSLSNELTKKIQKAMRPAPLAPILFEKTRDSITLQVLEGCEYRIEGGDWQESNVFTDLEIETEYIFYQRYSESYTYKSSNSSFSVKISTDGYSISEINIALDNVKMHKGEAKDANEIMQFSIYPMDVENKELLWESSNDKVAIVDEKSGRITALAEGKTTITVTAVDTTNGTISDSCILQVYDPSPVDVNAYLGTLKGVLRDSNGNILSGYFITLYSNPITIQTNNMGEYNIENVPYTNHTLVVENKERKEIGRFIINWALGEKSKANIDNTHSIINITYTENTSAINLPIEVNGSTNAIKVANAEDVTFLDVEGNEIMPKKIYMLVLMGIIAACIIGVGYILYIGRVQRNEEYYEDEELQEDDYTEEVYQQKVLSESANLHTDE